MKEEKGFLAADEPHPSAINALTWIKAHPIDELLKWQSAFATCIINGNRLAEICHETMRRLLDGEPVSDRYLLGLAWAMRGTAESTLVSGVVPVAEGEGTSGDDTSLSEIEDTAQESEGEAEGDQRDKREQVPSTAEILPTSLIEAGVQNFWDEEGIETLNALEVGDSLNLDDEDVLAHISDYGSSGDLESSPNGDFKLFFREGTSTTRPDCFGWYALVESGEVRVIGRMARPQRGAVSDRGAFVLLDALSDNRDKEFDLCVFDELGRAKPTVRLAKSLENLAISEDGSLVGSLFNEYQEATVDLYHIGKRVTRSNFIIQKATRMFLRRLELNSGNGTVTVYDDDGRAFRYTLEGTILDGEHWDAAWLEKARYWEIVDRVAKEMEKELDANEQAQCLVMLRKALEQHYSKTYGGAAYVYMAMIHEKQGKMREAIHLYEKAIEVNSALPIKRMLKQLKKAQGISA